MLFEAARTHGIDLPRSFMIGDRLSDTDAGKLAGCTTILIGEGAPDSEATRFVPDHRAESLLEATALILAVRG
jgi:D-glycero-D-manno-heptose 1,7-bisphosphate phosphatase